MFLKGHPSYTKIKYKNILFKCIICNEEFLAKENLNRKYCSSKCEFEALRQGFYPNVGFKIGHPRYGRIINPIVKLQCLTCQKYFYANKFSWNGKGKFLRKYCSKKCVNNGINHPNWKNGKSKELYDVIFDCDIRNEVKRRDNFVCQLCGLSEKDHLNKLNRVLSVHHIDYNKKRSLTSNLITLCCSCNVKVNYNREYWKNYFNNYLIKSNKLRNLTLEFVKC